MASMCPMYTILFVFHMDALVLIYNDSGLRAAIGKGFVQERFRTMEEQQSGRDLLLGLHRNLFEKLRSWHSYKHPSSN